MGYPVPTERVTVQEGHTARHSSNSAGRRKYQEVKFMCWMMVWVEFLGREAGDSQADLDSPIECQYLYTPAFCSAGDSPRRRLAEAKGQREKTGVLLYSRDVIISHLCMHSCAYTFCLFVQGMEPRAFCMLGMPCGSVFLHEFTFTHFSAAYVAGTTLIPFKTALFCQVL
jgi:hypothetical protein